MSMSFAAYGFKPGDTVYGRFFCVEQKSAEDIVKTEATKGNQAALQVAKAFMDAGDCVLLPIIQTTTVDKVVFQEGKLGVWIFKEAPLFIIAEVNESF
jgi:hypothetical protein